MADETKEPDAPRPAADDAPEQPRAPAAPRTDDKSPSPGSEIAGAGALPPPAETDAAPPTPESQAALTGKAPSGSSTSGTTVPATSGAQLPAEPSSAGPQPPGGASPSEGDPLKSPAQSDLEKAAKVAEAKARAAAAKQAAGDKPSPAQPGASGAAGAPKAPVKKKEEGPKPTDASGHPLVGRMRERFTDAVQEATEFVGQLSVRIERNRILEVCEFLRHDAETPFNFLSDLTCVHYPDRAESPFEVVYNLYSIEANERVRLKVGATDDEGVESVTSVWPTANWMEREVYDLFGVQFKNHPDLRRLLLPLDWEGHPLRKEYPLEFIENRWTAEHLPEFTEVLQEQVEQRRNYGLEILSVPEERRMREIFRGGKEVMSKDK